MSSIVSENPACMCPDWCVEHESAGRDGAVTIHNGERQALEDFTLTFDRGRPSRW